MPPTKCSKFGESQDQFGNQVRITYKGGTNYGTAVGGYVSLTARILIWGLALCQIWACFFKVSNFEWPLEGQLDVPNTEKYTMTYDGGFPTFAIYSSTSGSFASPVDLQGSYNNATVFDYYFTQVGET